MSDNGNGDDRRRSPQIDKLIQALVKAQGEMTHPPKDSENPHFKNRYASLATVLDTVRPVLARHGLAVLQSAGTGTRGPVLYTTVLHESGQWLALEPLELPAVKPDPQGWGSAISYGRRYLLLAVCGVTADEDDDANAASRPAVKRPAAPAGPAPARAEKKPTPTTGTELGNWLQDFDDWLSAAGRCDPGELRDHVYRLVSERHGLNPGVWTAAAVGWAVAEAKDFARQHPKRAG
jgi:ERF superfamily